MKFVVCVVAECKELTLVVYRSTLSFSLSSSLSFTPAFCKAKKSNRRKVGKRREEEQKERRLSFSNKTKKGSLLDGHFVDIRHLVFSFTLLSLGLPSFFFIGLSGCWSLQSFEELPFFLILDSFEIK